MKTVTLNIDETLYDTLLAMLHGLPKQKIEIIEENQKTKANIVNNTTMETQIAQEKLEQGKNIMRKLATGLGTSALPHDGSVNHDDYLYR
ncbi:hypothetical protein [Candidatus Albibeggiatoa sp. nov. BB20]|uniref:hypothetical protein n=1 Tax=Candidatus Albibeggiatoa sp. nov. BB20 TaxID=3162723 RepID=UPI003365AC46